MNESSFIKGHTLTIKLYSTGIWGPIEGNPTLLGASGENEVTYIYVELPTFLIGSNHFLEWAKPNGSKYISEPMSEIMHDGCTYAISVISNSLIDIPGKYEMEYKGITGNQVWKSRAAVTFEVYSSINAAETLPDSNPDFVTYVMNKLGGLDDDFCTESEVEEIIDRKVTAEIDKIVDGSY